MSRLLVMDYRQSSSDQDWLAMLLGTNADFQRNPVTAANAENHDAVLVVDDGGQAGVDALRTALTFRTGRPNLPIAVIKPLGDDRAPHENHATGLSRPGTHYGDAKISTTQFRQLLKANVADSDLSVHVSENAISFEYSGD